jgi:NADPH:quinone reductase-like Zn-dependent oxidoreductase
MKAITYAQYGSSEVLKFRQVEKPIPSYKQILIKIIATTVNSADIRLRKADPFLVRLVFGLFKPKIKILGTVIAGTVEAVGKDVTLFKIGDKVFGLNDTTMGTYAEYLAVPETIPLSLKPDNLNFEESAALVFGGHTALHFLKKSGITKGQKILIYGASGAVGTSAIQIAKHYGAEVTAVTSTNNINLVKSLGANKVIDYTTYDLTTIKEKYDIVYETVDKIAVSKIASLLKPNGVLILGAALIKGMLQGFIISRKMKLKLIAGEAKATPKDMEFIKQLAINGILKPAIDKTYNLEQIPQAHEYVEQGHKKGNVVIRIDMNKN